MFIAIDVETANHDISSICQIGMAVYEDDQLVKEYSTYIDPEDYFDPCLTSIHGIDEKTVESAPTIKEYSDMLYSILDNQIVVHHTHFDKISIKKALDKYDLPSLSCTWLDSAKIVRITWKQFASKGYGLANVTGFLQYDFKHHDALNDAKAAGFIVLSAMQETGLTIEDWLKRVKQPPATQRNKKHYNEKITAEGNPEGNFFGEHIVFTGALKIKRKEAAKYAAQAGFTVKSALTKTTTYMVIGNLDPRNMNGNEKSSKQKKAEQYIAKGQNIKIISEKDFFNLINFECKE